MEKAFTRTTEEANHLIALAKARGRPSDRGRFLRIDDVIATTGLSRRSIYRMVADDDFPKQHKLSPRSVGWWEADVATWLDSRLTDNIAA